MASPFAAISALRAGSATSRRRRSSASDRPSGRNNDRAATAARQAAIGKSRAFIKGLLGWAGARRYLSVVSKGRPVTVFLTLRRILPPVRDCAGQIVPSGRPVWPAPPVASYNGRAAADCGGGRLRAVISPASGPSGGVRNALARPVGG